MSSQTMSIFSRLASSICKRLALVQTLLLLTAIATPIYAQTISVDAPTVDAGAIPRGTAITKDFVVRNTGSADLHITDVRPTCGCTTVKFDKKIHPGGTGNVTLTIDTKSFRGAISKSADILSDDPNNPQSKLIVIANIKGYVTAVPAE